MIEHAQHAWGNFLKTVKAARGVNVLQTGQPLADELVPQVQVEDLGHLGEPTRFVQWGFGGIQVGGGAGTYATWEIRAVRPFWLTWFGVNLTAMSVFTQNAHTAGMGADTVPGSLFSGVPQCVYQIGTPAVAPPADAFNVFGGAAPFPTVFSGRGLFVPLGMVLVLRSGAANAVSTCTVICVEVPDPTTAP